MSDNGKIPKTLIKVDLKDGAMKIEFAHDTNIALLSHALRLANLELDNQIIASQAKQSPIQKVSQLPNILKNMRR